MALRLIVDCSVFWYKAWHRMKSADYEAESSLELEEFARNLSLEFFGLKERFQPTEMILGLDSKEWRTPYYRQYFADRVHFWKSRIDKGLWVVGLNQNFYIIKKDSLTGAWSDKKATAKEELALDLTDPERWVFFEKGKTPQYILDAHPNTFKTVQECPDWEVLQKRYPIYKGGRNSDWAYETSYKDFKKAALDLTLNLADTLGAKAVAVEGAEFDDIAHTYANQQTAVDTILCTTDQDMDQLMAKGLFFKIWNPGSGKNNPARWVEMSPELATFHLLVKLVGGDSSDKIPPVTTWAEKEKGPKNNKVAYRENTTWGTVKWTSPEIPGTNGKTADFCAQLMKEHGGLAGAHRYLKAHEVDSSYTRNLALMHLGAAPAEIQQACKEGLAKAEVRAPRYQLSDYLLTDRHLRLATQTAYAQREVDLAENRYTG